MRKTVSVFLCEEFGEPGFFNTYIFRKKSLVLPPHLVDFIWAVFREVAKMDFLKQILKWLKGNSALQPKLLPSSSTPPDPRVERVLYRAHSQIISGKSLAAYRLGFGGREPTGPTPHVKGRKKPPDGSEKLYYSDCVGFVSWAWGYDRFQKEFPLYGGWINTDSKIMAAENKLGWFEVLTEPRVGCIVAWPSIYERQEGVDGPATRVRVGHEGIVATTAAPSPSGPGPLENNEPFKGLSVIHCSGSADGVVIGPGEFWAGRENFKGKTNPEWRTRFLWPLFPESTKK